jgi:hypothetical protein
MARHHGPHAPQPHALRQPKGEEEWGGLLFFFCCFFWVGTLSNRVSNPEQHTCERLAQLTPQGGRHLFSKPNVFETDLHEADVRERLPELSAFFKESAARLAGAFTARLNQSQEVAAAAAAEAAAGVTGDMTRMRVNDVDGETDGGGGRNGDGDGGGDGDKNGDENGDGDGDGDENGRRGAIAAETTPSTSSLKIHPLVEGDDARTVKLQHNCGGGGCFPLHYDNPGPPSNRALTWWGCTGC